MVQSNVGEDPQFMIKQINAFLSRHAIGVIILLDHLIKFLRVVIILLAVGVLILGLVNIFYLNHFDLGVFQITTAYFFYRFNLERYKIMNMNHDLHHHQEAVGGLVDMVQRTSAPSSFFTVAPKKKNKLPN